MIHSRCALSLYALLIIFWFTHPLQAKEEAASRHLSYTIRPIQVKKELQLEVHLKFQADGQKSTFLFLPSAWAGQTKLYHEIAQLECLTNHIAIEDTERPDVKRIHHSPHEKIEIRYCIKSTHCQELEWYYRPIIEKSHFLFFGHCFFITPHIDHETSAHITLEWKHFPKDWNIANSFGAGELRQELYLPLSSFQHAVFSGGDFTLIPCGDGKAPLYVAVRDRWSFSIDHLTELLQTIIHGQRSFWKDDHFPYYLITVMPSKNDQYIAGTALTNAFSIFISDFQETSRENWNILSWLLSHEHFHTWNGMKMQSSTAKGSLLWFTEGFTDYYAIELNYRLHLLNFDEYLNAVNTIIYDYYTSPARNAENVQIQRKFWQDWHYQRLPYVRGFLLALKWNKQIQKNSQYASSLDDVMHALFKKVQKSGNPFDIYDIQEAAGKYIGKGAVTYDLNHYIIKGETIPMDDHLFEDFAVIDWIEALGFNVKQTITKGYIEGVVKDSSAYQAGLRNGQLFVKHDVTKEEVTVYISEDGRHIKVISYPHERRGEFIPQFAPLASADKIAA